MKQRHFSLAAAIVTTLATSLLSACNGSRTASPEGESSQPNSVEAGAALSAKERLGKLLFFESSLSTPPGQACSDCHDPSVAFANPDKELPVSRGAISGRYGNRNDMPAAYSAFVPPRHRDQEEGIWVGGLFWDGRVNTLAEQAQGPPLNPLEMANPDTAAIAETLRTLDYSELFTEVYGPDAFSIRTRLTPTWPTPSRLTRKLPR